MGYSFRQRRQVWMNARKKVGLEKENKQGHDDFIEECVTALIEDGEASNESEAEDICEIMWDEGQN